MRVGSNPNKKAIHLGLPMVVAATVTHLPNKQGYHEHRMDIMKLSLTSMRDGCDASITVWDNGSCQEFRDWLINEFKPDTLILSQNIGKPCALTALVNSVPAETIFAYGDDDMYYYPNWLEPQIELLQGFPNVGVVSGYPVRTQFRWGTEGTVRWAQENAEVITGRFIPDEWEYDFARSIGRDPVWHKEYSAKDKDTKIFYNGLEAYATGHHCQMVGYAGTLAKFARRTNDFLPSEKPFDIALDQAGYLRLTTTQRLVRHMGNVLDKELLADIQEVSYAS